MLGGWGSGAEAACAHVCPDPIKPFNAFLHTRFFGQVPEMMSSFEFLRVVTEAASPKRGSAEACAPNVKVWPWKGKGGALSSC